MTPTLAFETHGPDGGLPLVLLHGFPLDRRMWHRQVASWTAVGHRVILPDLPGHGGSPVPPGSATMAYCAQEVMRLLGDLRVSRFVLGGFSMGGYVALEIARTHRERLLGLMLVDTRAEPDSAEARAKRAETADDVRRKGMIVLEQAMLPKLLTETTRRHQPSLVDEVRAMIRAVPPEGAARALIGMGERPDQRPNLPRLHVPTLVIVGEEDEITPPSSSEAMVAQLPTATFERVPGAAHLTPMEAPDRVDAAGSTWLRALRRDVTAL